ncbi:PilW family protein [Pseudomonadota bacterium]
MKSLEDQQGFSLVEMMVAITISLILLAGVLQIFMSSKQANRMQEAMSRLQENGRFAVQFIVRDVRLADFWGCHGNLVNVTSDLNSAGAGYIDYTTGAIAGVDGGGGSDTLTVMGAYASGIYVVAPFMPNEAANLQVVAGANISATDILLVSDCVSADIFQVTNANPNGAKTEVVHNVGNPGITPGNATGNLSKTYDGDARTYKVRQVSYFVQNGAYGGPSLFRSENGNNQELIEGVEDIQVLYGQDTDSDGSANRYVVAGAAGLVMSEVVSLRVTLSLRTEDSNLSTSGDGRVRHVFTTTIAIRNRVS